MFPFPLVRVQSSKYNKNTRNSLSCTRSFFGTTSNCMLMRWLMTGPWYALSLKGEVRDRRNACQDSYDLNPERNHKLTYNILWGAEEALSKYVLWTCAQPCQGPWLRPRGYWQSFPKVKAARNGKAILWSARKCWECLRIWVFTNDQPDRSKASNCSCLLLGVQGYRLLPSVMFVIVAGTEVWGFFDSWCHSTRVPTAYLSSPFL